MITSKERRCKCSDVVNAAGLCSSGPPSSISLRLQPVCIPTTLQENQWKNSHLETIGSAKARGCFGSSRFRSEPRDACLRRPAMIHQNIREAAGSFLVGQEVNAVLKLQDSPLHI